ncbi:hypothetical protein ACFW2I_40065, partial [Streptomyces nigra]|uniref:hypothetical protein n=1 Tax=Streptomyces nigra TaxID=1827580 RepID=UPI0036767CCA
MTAATVTGESESALGAEFARRGWTDGLPATVPTAERVDAFLAAAGRDPEEVLLSVEENRR